MQNVVQTIVSQYAASPTILALIDYMNQWKSPDANVEAFYNLVMNLPTAQGYGLDVWGRIVGVVRVLTVSAGDYFGFEGDTGASGLPFTQAIFYEGQPATTNYALTDDAFRQLIYAKAAANISTGSIQAINAMLTQLLFPGRGNAYVVDNLDMTLTYKFEFALQPFEVSIVVNSGVMPTPTGVQASVSYVPA